MTARIIILIVRGNTVVSKQYVFYNHWTGLLDWTMQD